jgi:hypothetical protein
MRRVAVLLAHHPVLDRQKQVVTTAITNLDLHDISRSAYTFGLSDFFVAHPVAAQRELALRVKSHWTEGSGAKRIPDRKPAMGIVRVISSIQDAQHELGGPELWVTSAQTAASSLSFSEARTALDGEGPPVLLVLGTGWGLSPEVVEQASARLEPITSPRADGYNHLSVRAAAAIMFDRLLGLR